MEPHYKNQKNIPNLDKLKYKFLQWRSTIPIVPLLLYFEKEEYFKAELPLLTNPNMQCKDFQ